MRSENADVLWVLVGKGACIVKRWCALSFNWKWCMRSENAGVLWVLIEKGVHSENADVLWVKIGKGACVVKMLMCFES